MHVCMYIYIYNNYFYLLLLFVTLLKHTYHFFITMNNVMQQKLALCDTLVDSLSSNCMFVSDLFLQFLGSPSALMSAHFPAGSIIKQWFKIT